ncbi:MAG: N-terminal domain of Peptidase [Mucilaginibacter sp.]|nr:N-terminal domain of Peptidase [Mucilaginibacter sp.]
MKIIALFLLMLSFTCMAQEKPQSAAAPMTPELKKIVIDTLSKALLTNYVYIDKARHMDKYIKGQLAKGAYRSINDPQQFAKQIAADLQTACPDLHMSFRFVPQLAQMGAPPMHAPNPHDDSLRNVAMEERNFTFTAANILPGNVGYIKFNGFIDVTPSAKETVTAAFRFVRYTKAVIIDLRENHGGSPEMVKQVESYFFPEKTRVNDIIVPNKRDTAKGWTDPTATSGLFLRMPVYVLTSSNTVSAAEDFAYAMQVLKRATIAGEKTAGGSHPVGPVFLGHGFVAGIPFAHTYNIHTGTEWEGTGVVPDIALKADASLDEVNSTIFPNSWFANQQKAVDRPVEPSAIQAYLGTYEGGLRFYVKEGGLYCENPERGNQVFKLRYISPGFFQLDENVQVKFGQQQGSASGMQFYWSNGNISFKRKTQ